MAIVKLKTRDQKVSELLNMFRLPGIDIQIQVKPRPEPVVGGSAANINSRRQKDFTQ